MSLELKILGRPGRDNALFVRVNSGQNISRLLFDCGEACLYGLTRSEIQNIDEVFFSHYHMDHICGFDTLFRANFSRGVQIWGPPGTIDLMHHRFQGYLWNLHEGRRGRWTVNETNLQEIQSTTLKLKEAFKNRSNNTNRAVKNGIVFEHEDYQARAIALDHGTISLGWRIDETNNYNIDSTRLEEHNLSPGNWIQSVKDSQSDPSEEVALNNKTYTVSELRKILLIKSKGESVAYLTDFRLDNSAKEKLIPFLENCTTLVCEAQYLSEDQDLAEKNYHSTVEEVAELAKEAQVENLILFHLSDRYPRDKWKEMLQIAQSIFPSTSFSGDWTEKV